MFFQKNLHVPPNKTDTRHARRVADATAIKLKIKKHYLTQKHSKIFLNLRTIRRETKAQQRPWRLPTLP